MILILIKYSRIEFENISLEELGMRNDSNYATMKDTLPQCDIKKKLKKEIITLTDSQAEYVLTQLQRLIQREI